MPGYCGNRAILAQKVKQGLMNKFPPSILALEPQERSFICEIHKTLGCKNQLTKDFIRVTFMMIKMFDFKQESYGSLNISKFSDTGIMVRLSDKIERIINLWKTGNNPGSEAVEDSYGDIAVYGAIALMCRWGLWPGVKK